LLLSNRYVSAFAKHLSKKKNPVSNNKPLSTLTA
jgi:hypothetical protein